MALKRAGVEVTLVIWMGRVEVLPTRMVPKSRDVGEKTRLAGLAGPRRLMNSSAVLESEVISIALMRLPMVWGVKATVRVQEALATRVAQLLVTVKSGVVCVPMMWMVAVPVLVRVTVWVVEALPTCVAGKGRDPGEAVKETRGAVLVGEATRTGAA